MERREDGSNKYKATWKKNLKQIFFLFVSVSSTFVVRIGPTLKNQKITRSYMIS